MKLKTRIIKWLLALFPQKERQPGKLKKKFGISKDTFDLRDYKTSVQATVIPLKYSIPINPLKYVKNQGSWNSCGAHAITTALEITHELNKTNLQIPLSERYHYYYARQPEYAGQFPKNVGMTSRDMLKVAQKIGISPEKLCPYISTEMNDKPKYFAEQFAGTWKIGPYFRVNSITEAKETLNSNKPVLIGVYCNNSFLSLSGDITYKKGDITKGGHEFVIYGYDDVSQSFLCINSWGSGYKDKGLMSLPYDYVENLAIDMWTFRLN